MATALPTSSFGHPAKLMIFFHDAAGAWTRVALPSLHLGEEGMALGDVNGDGAVDLVLHGRMGANPGAATARNPARWQATRLARSTLLSRRSSSISTRTATPTF